MLWLPLDEPTRARDGVRVGSDGLVSVKVYFTGAGLQAGAPGTSFDEGSRHQRLVRSASRGFSAQFRDREEFHGASNFIARCRGVGGWVLAPGQGADAGRSHSDESNGAADDDGGGLRRGPPRDGGRAAIASAGARRTQNRGRSVGSPPVFTALTFQFSN
jgi:hypothetical protein